jgi:hypothetical protein
MRGMGYLSAIDAIRLLEAGVPIYVVSAPADTNALPLDGAWKDDNGQVYFDCSAVVLNPATAREIGREYNQQYILRITPCADGNSKVYLLKDSELARKVSLAYCGGYTADGVYLFTAVDANRCPFEDDYDDWLYADCELIPVK